MNDLPFRAEYAKTGRAGCKLCKTPIPATSLRIAAMVQSAFHDGKQPNWFHENCFFMKQRPSTVGDIQNFSNLKYEDQQKIQEKLEAMSGVVLPSTSKGKGKGKKRKVDDPGTSLALKDYGVEYAVSGRAQCVGCQLKIMKDEIRVKKTVYDTEVGMKFGGQPLWHHLECFEKLRTEIGFFASGDKLPGFNSLNKEDKAKVLKALPATKLEESELKKWKKEPKDEAEIAQDKADELLYAAQNKAVHKLGDKLRNALNKNELITILKENSQQIPVGVDAIIERVTDIMTFGALKPCETCKTGQFVFDKAGYVCSGDLTEWVKCLKVDKQPKRRPCKLPEILRTKFDFLAKYKSKVQNRVIKYFAPSGYMLNSSVKKEENGAPSEPRIKRETPVLYNMEFIIIGKTKQSKEEIGEKIKQLGGKLTTKLHKKTSAVISTAEEVKKMGSRMCQAQDLDIQVVPEDYLDDLKPGEAVSFITSKSICDWGSDPHTRIQQNEDNKSKSKSIYTKSMPSKVKLTLKGGLAVDPDTNLEDQAHVYKNGKDIYNCILTLTDIQSGKNSYYKMQILQSDTQASKFWFFRSWGRIGTKIGGSKVEDMPDFHSALQQFQFYFMDKTGNDWNGRANFRKMPQMYCPIDVDYGGSNENEKKLLESAAGIKSALPTEVQNLVSMLFDVDAMKKVMMEFELDMEKMPLGRLSKQQIEKAYSVLSELSALVTSGGRQPQFIDASNRFYSLVPHDFGVALPPLIETLEVIKQKTEMLDSLLEIELAYSMLNAKTEGDQHPLDSHYHQLKTDMEPIKHESDEFVLLEKYVKNTHAATHEHYELEILEIFKIRRKNEERRYKPFKKLHNRKLLWHGSRVTNYVGILSHGLKIAPPEAPSTGYMFGKGIYFADMVSKSANYCFTSKQNTTGLLMLCEVALGDMMELTEAKYVEKLPKNKHSVKGVGRTQPNASESHTREDGVEIPLGKPVIDTSVSSSLLYNEYIVYDVAQVHAQYLFKTNFKYKY